jgi:hypothetical protein
MTGLSTSTPYYYRRKRHLPTTEVSEPAFWTKVPFNELFTSSLPNKKFMHRMY